MSSDQGRVSGKQQTTITLGGGNLGPIKSPSSMVIPGARPGYRYEIGRLPDKDSPDNKPVAVTVLSVDSNNFATLSAEVPSALEGDPFRREYTLKPYVVGIWAEMSAFVRSLKGDPIKEVCDRLDLIPPDQQQRWMKVAVDAAANQTPTEQELAAFEKSLLGTAFKLWTTLVGAQEKRDQAVLAEFPSPHAVMDKLVKLSESEGEKKLAEIMLKLEVASGEADLKNSPGQPATTA